MDGSTKSLLILIDGMLKKGVDVAVVGPQGDGALRKIIENKSIAFYPANVVRSQYPRPNYTLKGLFGIKVVFIFLYLYFLKIKNLFEILKIVRNYSPDIIHSNSGVLREGFWASKLCRIPHVWHLREYQDLEIDLPVFPTKRLFEWQLANSYVITITDDIRKHFNLLKNAKARTIYNGIFDEAQTTFIWPKHELFLCASNIVPYKGHDMVIRAFSRFNKKNPQYKLVILGFGEEPWIRKLIQLSIETGCDDSIIWEGYQEDVFKYMSEAKGLIVASKYEGFGRMTAEACFAGCVVIGKNNSGTKEIIDKTGGFLFENEDELLEKMENLININEIEYKIIVEKAQVCAKKLYSIRQNIDNTLHFYEDILNKS